LLISGSALHDVLAQDCNVDFAVLVAPQLAGGAFAIESGVTSATLSLGWFWNTVENQVED
jgi:hypothetical protein